MSTAVAIREQLSAALEAAQDGHIPDIERLLHKRGAFDQRFTIVIFAFAEVSRCVELMGSLVAIMEKADESRALIIQQVLVPDLARHEQVLRNRFGLSDAADYLHSVRAALGETNQDGLLELSRDVASYFAFLNFMIAVQVPWNELSASFEGAQEIRASASRRLVAI